MAYLGNVPARSFISFERQVFTIVNSQTAYTLSHSVTNENDIRLVVNNIVQEPGSGKAYTASGTTLTLSAALTNGTDEMYCVFLGKAVGTVNAPAGSVGTSQLASDAVTEAKIADGAVESEHLNNNVISGQTELASAPASTDELLISDAGTLKRIDVSLVGGDNTPAWYARLGSTQTISNETYVKIQFGSEVVDTDSAYDNSTNYRWTCPSGKAGKYYIFGNIYMDSGEDNGYKYGWLQFRRNGTAFAEHIVDLRDSLGRQNSVGHAFINDVAVGDYYELFAYISDTSGSPTIKGGSAGASDGNSSNFGGFKLIGV